MMIFKLLVIFLLVLDLVGCDAFVRKFTRKPKQEEGSREAMVLAPEEYKNPLSKEEMYRQYFMFWKAWQDELISALLTNVERPNYKKQVDSANEAVKNLMSMRALLNSDAGKKLDVYLNRMIELRDSVQSDVYGAHISWNRMEAERIKRDVLQNFSFSDIKNSLL